MKAVVFCFSLVFLVISVKSLMGFNNRSRETYFDFHSIFLSQNGKEIQYRCVLCSDQSGELKFNTSYSVLGLIRMLVLP